MIAHRSAGVAITDRMGRPVLTAIQLLNDECGEWIRMKTVLPEPEKKALRELLEAALARSDPGSIVPRPIPSETMFMLMLNHLKAKIDRFDDGIQK